MNARHRRWYRANPGKIAEKQKRDAAWRKAKLRDGRPSAAEQAVITAGRNRERLRRWKAANPERWKAQVRAGGARHRARHTGAPGTATADDIAARWAYYGGRCWICRTAAAATDHVIPLARGGSNWPANLRPICAPCNSRKRDRDPREFMASAS